MKRWWCLALLLGALACETRGDKAAGDPCASRRECAGGLCVAGLGSDEPRCTQSCASSDECPEGWSCSGATEENVVICRPGSATPFGR
ncbi:MAG: hypothetical protein AAGH15_17360 [Myxococcota bacterium]